MARYVTGPSPKEYFTVAQASLSHSLKYFHIRLFMWVNRRPGCTERTLRVYRDVINTNETKIESPIARARQLLYFQRMTRIKEWVTQFRFNRRAKCTRVYVISMLIPFTRRKYERTYIVLLETLTTISL
mgnify:CR=1 FL=1